MDMPINQTRADVTATQINFFSAPIFTHTYNIVSADGNVSGFDFIGKHIDDSGIFQNKIGANIPLPALQSDSSAHLAA